MDTIFCIECVTEAIKKYGIPAIFNTDCGSQYTSKEFVSMLQSFGIQISMDGIGRCLDNIFISCEILIYAKEWPETLSESFISDQDFA